MTTEQQNPLPMAQTAPDQPEEKDPAQIDYEQGVNYLKDKDYAMAANAFHNALVGYEQTDNQEGVANANDKLGDICKEKGEFEKAIFYYDRVFNICKNLDDVMSQLALRKKLSICHRGMKQYEKAIEIYLDMLDVYEKFNNPASSVATLEAIGETYEEAGEPAKAADAYETAGAIHANFGHKKQTDELNERAAKLRG